MVSLPNHIYLGADKDKWLQFQNFYEEISRYVKSKKPGLKLAAEATLPGIIGPAQEYIKELNRHSDVIGVSYYPMKENGDVKEPAALHQDLDDLVKLYESKPIYLYQFGYPSSKLLKSSPDKQAEFIHEAFKAWDKHAERIIMIDFTWLYDTPEQSIKEISRYYGINTRKFTEFIGTLGLCTHDGKEKPAFKTLQAEARTRGW